MKIKNCKLKIGAQKGVTSLATMLVLGAVVVQIGLVAFILSYYLTSSNAGVKFSSYALSAAQAGIDEGIVRTVRGDYTNAVQFSVIGAGGATVQVTICKGTTSGCNPDVSGSAFANKVQIVSSASVLNKKSFLVALVDVDPTTHLVRIESVIEKDTL